jgi:DNA-binding transcriptional MerR regulator
MAAEQYLKTGPAARLAELSTQGLYLLEKRGELHVAARTKGGQRLYKRSDVLRVRDARRARAQRRGEKTGVE